MRFTKFLSILSCLSCVTLIAETAEFPVEKESIARLEARNYSRSTERRKQKNITRTTQRKSKNQEDLYFGDTSFLSKPKELFFRTDIGLGFLYFRDTRGNLGILPGNFNRSSNSNAGYRGRLGYNRTPLYDYQAGYRVLDYLTLGMSYMHQANITVSTPQIKSASAVLNGVTPCAFNQLRANLELDALLFKAYLDSPWAFVSKGAHVGMFLATGVGFSWQTWSSLVMNAVAADGSYVSYALSLKQKVSNNFMWMADLGFKISPIDQSKMFSFLMGCKFNIWGQARQMGALTQQGTQKLALFKPFSSKTVYQWAPYVSLQWNIPNYTRLPLRRESGIDIAPFSSQMTVGLGLLYFRNINGNLLEDPNNNGATNQGWQSIPVPSKLSYNRTPLFDLMIQRKINPFLELAFSYQNQSGISVRTQPVGSRANLPFDYTSLNGYLSFNAMLLKAYLKAPFSGAYESTQYTPYFGVGLGPGWQTWDRIFVYRSGGIATVGQTTRVAASQPLKQKISANLVFNLDWGLQVTHKNASQCFSGLMGCKFNYWGQARNIGKMQSQNSSNIGILEPFRAKRVFQWAPYLGVQWSFPYQVAKKYNYLDGKDPASWVPYVISLNVLESSPLYFAQMNIGLGLLYFRGLRANFALQPNGSTVSLATDVPLKGRLNYNRSPIFEYLFGYTVSKGFTVGLSYQHQGNVTVQSKMLDNYSLNTAARSAQKTIFTSDLVLDAIMAKFAYEAQKALVFRNCVYSPYGAVAVGGAWQTWKNANVTMPFIFSSVYETAVTNLRQKVSANVAFMIDAGFRLRSPVPGVGISASLGMKFNFWGQARSMGKLRDAQTPKYALSQPFSVKTLYQWAPYFGLQWNF